MAGMISIIEFKKKIEKREINNIYLALGKESMFMDDICKYACDTLVDPATKDFNLDIFQGDNLNAPLLGASLNSLPMMAEYRVVLVKHADAMNSSTQNYLLDYVKNPSIDTVLILLYEGDNTKAWVKKFSELVVTIKCDTPRGRSLTEWINKRVRELGTEIDNDAITLLTDEGGLRLIDINNELEKAALLADKDKPINAEILQKVWGINSEMNIWSFFDHIASGSRLQALREFYLLGPDFERMAGLGFTQVSRKFRSVLMDAMYKRMRVPVSQQNISAKATRQWQMSPTSVKSLPANVAKESLIRMQDIDRLRKTRSFNLTNMFERFIHQVAIDRKESSQ